MTGDTASTSGVPAGALRRAAASACALWLGVFGCESTAPRGTSLVAPDGGEASTRLDATPEGGRAGEARPDAGDAGDAGEARPDAGDAGDAGVGVRPAYVWSLPPGFPAPFVPAVNPMSEAKVELGRRLFYDVRLSGNQTMSCASCHEQRLAFTDGRARSIGSTGMQHPRSAMSLANVGYATTLTWANPLFFELNRQAMIPLFGDSPVEMGLRTQEEIEQRLRAVPFYVDAFARAFPGEAEPVTLLNLRRALEAFQRTLISGRAPYDRFRSGQDPSALDAAAQRGLALFESPRLGCSACHSGFNFSDHVYYVGAAGRAMPYHNVGLYDVDGRGAYPEHNTGVYEVTLNPADMGAFKAPTLRNIAVTAPYMHDGSVATLGEVIELFAAGGRDVTSGPFAGDGRRSPLKDPLLQGFAISPEEKADLLRFLESLTDDEFLHDPRFSDPWR